MKNKVISLWIQYIRKGTYITEQNENKHLVVKIKKVCVKNFYFAYMFMF